MASIRNQRKAQIQEALKKAGSAYRQGDYDSALKILQSFSSDKAVQKAIAKISIAKQETSKSEPNNVKPKRKSEDAKTSQTKQVKQAWYILIAVIVGMMCWLLSLAGGSSSNPNSSNSFVFGYASDYYTAFDDVIVWTCANFACESLVELPVGTRVSFIEALEGEASPVDGTTLWYHVRLSDNREGFINSRVLSYIRPTPRPTLIPPPPVSYPSNNSSNQRTWNCRRNTYNCEDLSCSEVASYMSACPNDPSNLDGDDDGEACEREC
jgi:hypothetical protein